MGNIGNEIESIIREGTRYALEAAAITGVNYARSKTDIRVQGAEPATGKDGKLFYRYSDSLPKREAHPGGWADVTGLLAENYAYTTELTKTQGTITFINPVSYAEELEERAGYWVLEGLIDYQPIQKTFDDGLEGFIDAN